VSIVSPTEKAFQKNQARIWKAKIGDFQPKGNERYDCYWMSVTNDNVTLSVK
jgi:hypothetical protein